jgi:Mrp family chromosome partitioning ATPase
MESETGSSPGVLAALWKHKVLIVFVVALSIGAAYGLSIMQPTIYAAEGDVLLSDPRTSGGIAEDIGLVLDPSRYVRNQQDVMSSPQVAAQASILLDGALTPREVQRDTTVTPASDRDKLTVRATQPTAEGAVALVDALVEAYEIVVRDSIESRVGASIATLEASEDETRARIAELDARIEEDPDNAVLEAQRAAAVDKLISLESRIDALTTNATLYGSGVLAYVPPDVPESPTQPKPVRNAAIAGVLGFFAAASLAWWRGDKKVHVEDRAGPAEVLSAPLLAVIPDFATAKAHTNLPAAIEPASQPAEAYQFLASFVRFALDRIGGNVVLVTSTGVGDGKTTTAANLAFAASSADSHPLLIDADERTQGLTRLAEMETLTGLSELVDRRGDANQHVHHWKSALIDTPTFVVPTGNQVHESMSYLRSARFRQTLSSVTAGHDLVVIDAPSLLAVAETVDLAAMADGVILVVRPGTPLAELQAARDQLELSGAMLLGYVYNRAPRAESGFGYGGLAYGHITSSPSNRENQAKREGSLLDGAPDSVH